MAWNRRSSIGINWTQAFQVSERQDGPHIEHQDWRVLEERWHESCMMSGSHMASYTWMPKVIAGASYVSRCLISKAASIEGQNLSYRDVPTLEHG